MRTADGTVVEVFEWVSQEAIAGAHRNSAVQTVETFRGRVFIRDAGQPARIPEDVLTFRADLEQRRQIRSHGIAPDRQTSRGNRLGTRTASASQRKSGTSRRGSWKYWSGRDKRSDICRITPFTSPKTSATRSRQWISSRNSDPTISILAFSASL